MIKTIHFLLLGTIYVLLAACSNNDSQSISPASEHGAQLTDFERGPHGGRLLEKGEFTLELAIFELGVPPEFRAWASTAGIPTDPEKVKLEVRLTRLGNRIDQINFQAQDEFLRGDQVVYEPHSFIVSIDARVGGISYQWEYDNFEGRTKIDAAVAASFGLETGIAGPAQMRESIEVYGRIEPIAENVSIISARFEGLVQSVLVSLGEDVEAGQPLLLIESNESLKTYQIKAPINGTVTELDANVGEATAGRQLLTIIDPSSVWVNLAIFPSNHQRVRAGAPVTIFLADGASSVTGTVDRLDVVADDKQAVMARVEQDNTDGQFFPGSFVHAQIQVAEYTVPLAVKRIGLQAFRDFTVVYAQIGDEYEVRMLELGRQDDEWVEILAGLEPGTRYVTSNSYLIKADIEKSGASHDH